eukprot:Pompholyxophrys_punicea_v1_NODE_1204_length_868_cov_14.371614.p2 type:complete len:113 gc:universal NODE_1204_length_868_cov_14.371614:130-468(+)
MEIPEDEIAPFTTQINSLSPLPDQLCFLDEFATDITIRKKGWFLRGHRPVYKSFFQRGSRISGLSFLGVNGLFETFTEGTFNRLHFFECCQKLLDSGIFLLVTLHFLYISLI